MSASTTQHSDAVDAVQLQPVSHDRTVVLHTRVVTGSGGGPDKTILNSARFLEDSPYWLAAAYMHPPGDPGFEAVRRRAAEARCPMLAVPDGGPLDPGVLRRLLKICREHRVRIWHGHDYKSNMLGLMLRPLHPMKLVTTVHGWVKHTARTPIYYAVDRWSLPYFHHVVCVSADLEERVRGLGLPAERVSLIHNAIDEVMFKRSGPAPEAPMRREVGTPPGRLLIGAVGRLSAEKAFNLLIRAVHTLVQEGLDLELWIAGDGDARPELEKLIARLGLDDRVRLLGFVSDTIALYESLDLFVLSSLREGLPNVVLEAMSMSTPVVSTRVAGVPRVIDDGETGLLCDCGDLEGLTEAVRRAARDAELRQRLAAAGRRLIERELSFSQRMQRIRAIYDQVLGAEAPAEHAPAPAGV